MSLLSRDRSRPLVAADSASPVNDTLSAAQLALSAVPGVALALTLRLLILSYRRAAGRPAEPTWEHYDDYL